MTICEVYKRICLTFRKQAQVLLAVALEATLIVAGQVCSNLSMQIEAQMLCKFAFSVLAKLMQAYEY